MTQFYADLSLAVEHRQGHPEPLVRTQRVAHLQEEGLSIHLPKYHRIGSIPILQHYILNRSHLHSGAQIQPVTPDTLVPNRLFVSKVNELVWVTILQRLQGLTFGQPEMCRIDYFRMRDGHCQLLGLPSLEHFVLELDVEAVHLIPFFLLLVWSPFLPRAPIVEQSVSVSGDIALQFPQVKLVGLIYLGARGDVVVGSENNEGLLSPHHEGRVIRVHAIVLFVEPFDVPLEHSVLRDRGVEDIVDGYGLCVWVDEVGQLAQRVYHWELRLGR